MDGMNMSIVDIKDPVEQFVAFIEERENIRVRRSKGYPWPWTYEPILQQYRFTNIHREDDATSRHYQKSIRDRYGEDEQVFPGTLLYRWFNRISTCDSFFNEPNFTNKSIFELYIGSGDYDILLTRLNQIPTPHVTGAYLIPSPPGYTKGEGVLLNFHNWCHRYWRDIWKEWTLNPPTLQEMYNSIIGHGLGTFMTAQIVADLKYLPTFRKASDWWTFAAPGPGSKKGLNFVIGADMDSHWTLNAWRETLNELNERVTPMLEDAGIDKLHNQDLQNCLCEFSKFTKVARGLGRPRQTFKHGVV
jgi:hypothetical protein